MNDEDKKILLAEVINTAQEAKNHAAKGTAGRTALNRIIRLAKTLYADTIKPQEIPPA